MVYTNLDYDDSAFVIYVISRAFVSDCSIKSHNSRYRAVYSLGGLFLVHLDISCLVGSDIHVTRSGDLL